MVASTKTLDSLKAIGLNKYERNLWVALLSRGSSTAGELSDISKVPRSRCYDVLESLAARGFIVVQPGKPLKYVAVNPREALERAKKKVMEEAKETGEKMERLSKSDSIKELERLHRDNIKTMQPEELTGALKGRYAMMQQVESMLKRAKKSIKFITTDTGLLELMENHSHLLKKAADSGVKIHLAVPINDKTNDHVKELAKYAQLRNVEDVGHIEKLGGRLFLIDGNEFILGLTDDTKTHPTQDISLWTQSEHAASHVIEPMFELVWHNSKPFGK